KQEKISHYVSIVEEMTEEFEPERIAAAAIRLYQEGEPEEKLEVDKERFKKTGAKEGMTRLFINIGKEKNISKEDIVNYICEEGDMKKKDIKNIRILDKFTFLEVPEEVSERIIAVLHKSVIKGHKIHAEPARPIRKNENF
ncbi:MAG: RNA helicase, partial [Thermodesulfobium narugense]